MVSAGGLNRRQQGSRLGGILSIQSTVTVLATSAIPNGINSYERLLIWAAQCCQSIGNGLEVNVQENAGSVPVAQVQLGATADGVYRFIVTAYIPCDANALNSSSLKTWMAAQDIATATPHTNLLSN